MKSYLKEISMLPCSLLHYSPKSGMDMARCLAKEDVKPHTYTEEYYSALRKKGKPVICDNMDEPEGHYAKLHKSDLERPMLHDHKAYV